MNLRKNGFTLIELLAVIVILAIIALIATPIILGIINDVKEQSNRRSIEMYAKAIENAIMTYKLKENEKTMSFEKIEEYIEYDGANVGCDVVEVYEDGNIYLYGCVVNNNSKSYIYGQQHLDQTNVKAATETTKTTGIVPEIDENGNIEPGSEFKIKVSNNIKDKNGEIVEYTFFVLSNDGDYVNLIAEQNIAPDGTYTRELQTGDEWYVTKADNRYGPQTAYTYLSNATSNWTNIPMIEGFNYLDIGNQNDSTYGYQSIVTQLDQVTGKYITTIKPYSSDYGNPVTYQNMRARLPYVSEVSENTSCKVYKSSELNGTCPLWMVNYLYKNNYYSIN